MPEVPEEVSASHAADGANMQSFLKQLSRPRVAATLVAAFVAACAATQVLRGVESTPGPVREMLVQSFGYSADTAGKLVIAGEIGAAAAIVVGGTRLLAVSGAVAGAFLSLACVSAAFRQGGMLLPVIALAISLGLTRMSTMSTISTTISTMGTPAAAQRPRRGLSAAWTAFAALAAATTAAHLSAAIWAPHAVVEPISKSGTQAIDFDMKPFVGKLLSESPVGAYMPQLVARIGAEDAVIVFYNPYCDACHTLFAENFSTPRTELSVAVEIPIAAGATLATDQPPEPIVCALCEKTSLPPGPAWMIAAPMTVRVEKGVIRCVSDRFGGDCFTHE